MFLLAHFFIELTILCGLIIVLTDDQKADIGRKGGLPPVG
jgi:hypothetical protein